MLFRNKDGKVTIVCIRGQASKADLEHIYGGDVKEPILTIPCATQEHEDCGGDGCECDCHKQK